MIPTFNVSDAVANPKLLDNAVFSRPLTPEERKSKIKREEWGALVSHLKDILISLFALVSVSVFIYICVTIINSATSSPDDKKWATSVITLITSGVIGYLSGKASK
jgi:hypothetical protein